VQEIWRFDRKRLSVLRLDETGQFTEQNASKVFPFLPMDGFNAILKRFETEDPLTVLRAFREWILTLP
jgi:hypothetical protein